MIPKVIPRDPSVELVREVVKEAGGANKVARILAKDRRAVSRWCQDEASEGFIVAPYVSIEFLAAMLQRRPPRPAPEV